MISANKKYFHYMMKKYYKRIGKNIKFINIDNIKNNKILGMSCNYIIIDDYIDKKDQNDRN